MVCISKLKSVTQLAMDKHWWQNPNVNIGLFMEHNSSLYGQTGKICQLIFNPPNDFDLTYPNLT